MPLTLAGADLFLSPPARAMRNRWAAAVCLSPLARGRCAGGEMFLTGGTAAATGGAVYLVGGYSSDTTSGHLRANEQCRCEWRQRTAFLQHRTSSNGDSGSITIATGSATGGAGGDVSVAVGSASTGGGEAPLLAGTTRPRRRESVVLVVVMEKTSSGGLVLATANAGSQKGVSGP